jgi:hypothetical protein
MRWYDRSWPRPRLSLELWLGLCDHGKDKIAYSGSELNHFRMMKSHNSIVVACHVLS